jgi:streptogramin lyase
MRELLLNYNLLPKYGLVVEYDLDGNVLKSWHDPTGQVVSGCTNIAIHDGKMYLGSFYIGYIVQVDY